MTRPDAGFTLVEALVAMAVLAVAAGGLIRATEAHVDMVAQIEERTAARWVAENRLAEIRLGLPRPATVPMLGRDWRVATRIRPSGQPGLVAVEVAVSRPGGAALVTLNSFNVEPGT